MRKKVTLLSADLCLLDENKKALTGELKQKAVLGGLGDGLSPYGSSYNLPLLNKVFSLPSFFGGLLFFFSSLFLLEAFRLRSSAKYRLASSVQFQAASQLPAPSVENTRE